MDLKLSRINLITGEKDIGKTQLCAKLVHELKKKNFSVAGIISPGKYANNKKVGIHAENITNGEIVELACFSPGWDKDNQKRIWKINDAAIPWGNSVLKEISFCDVLIIDEVGFLELEKKSGWSQVFKILEDEIAKFVFIVIRPGLIDIAIQYWKGAQVIELKSKEHRDHILSSIMSQLEIICAR